MYEMIEEKSGIPQDQFWLDFNKIVESKLSGIFNSRKKSFHWDIYFISNYSKYISAKLVKDFFVPFQDYFIKFRFLHE